MKACMDRMEKFGQRFGKFVGTAESEKTLKAVLDLEQMMGREIAWVRGESFEALVRRKGMLPNTDMRFCTTELKIRPIAEHVYHKTGGGRVINNTGIRGHEMHRVKAHGHRSQSIDIEVGTHPNGNRKWLNYEFAEAAYPLIEWQDGGLRKGGDRLTKEIIYKWAYSSGIDWPESSNCQMCYHKPLHELRRNCDDSPAQMMAAADMEQEMTELKGRVCTLKKGHSIRSIMNAPRQLDIFNKPKEYFWGEHCESTYCTD